MCAFRNPMSPDQQHRDSPPLPMPAVPFGINSLPPGFSFSSSRPMQEPPRMMMMPQQFSPPPPNMNGPNQQQSQQPQAQQPKREVPSVNSTSIPVQSMINSNTSRGNNNTRRETEQTTTTTKPTVTVTTRKPFQEPPLGIFLGYFKTN